MTAPIPLSGWSRPPITSLALLTATALACFLCYRMAVPFVPALAWALALAVLVAPLQQWLETKLRRPSVAAFVSVAISGLMVVVPITFVGQHLVVQATKGAELIHQKVGSGEWRGTLEAHPRLAEFARRIELQFDLPGIVKTSATWLSSAAGSIVKGSATQLAGLGLTFYLLFFFLRDRRVALASLRRLSPLSAVETDRLFGRIGDTIHATLYGALVVSCVQGLLGGLMFWWLGLPAPFLWGVVMALLAVVPMLGAFIVWAPAAGFLALDGHFGQALILTLWGALVVGTVDNLIRPIFVGNRLKLHTVLTFLSVVGGIMLFGSAGLVLGPIALTVTIVLLDTWSAGQTFPLPPSS